MLDLFRPGGEPTAVAGEIDAVFFLIVAITMFFFVLVEGLLIGFAIRYRRRRKDEAAAAGEPVTGNRLLEIVWVVIPSVVVLVIFGYGYVAFRHFRAPIPGAQEIQVVAAQWLFEFRYPDGRKAINELHVAAGRPVKLVMTSRDVIHSFYVPDFRIKQDILPGRYTDLWFRPEKTGTYTVLCAEYCGTGHSAMMAKVVVLPAQAYDAWAAEEAREAKAGAAASLAGKGEEVAERLGCIGCHSTDGSRKVGPTFKGLYGRKVVLADGRTLTADDRYIRDHILDPASFTVKGFPGGVMPSFRGRASDDDIAAMTAWIRRLSGAPVPAGGGPVPPAERGRELFAKSGCGGCHTVDGTPKVGPTMKGIFGRRAIAADGSSVAIDENYLRESIVEPGARVAKGFPNIMPTFKATLSEDDLAAIVAYLKTLK